MPENQDKPETFWHYSKKFLRLFWGPALFVFALWSSSIYAARHLQKVHSTAFENTGILGDSFGAVNALFTGLAFAGVIATILLQMKELSSQEKQSQQNLEESRRALAAQQDQQSKQTYMLSLNTILLGLRRRRDELKVVVSQYMPETAKHLADTPESLTGFNNQYYLSMVNFIQGINAHIENDLDYFEKIAERYKASKSDSTLHAAFMKLADDINSRLNILVPSLIELYAVDVKISYFESYLESLLPFRIETEPSVLKDIFRVSEINVAVNVIANKDNDYDFMKYNHPAKNKPIGAKQAAEAHARFLRVFDSMNAGSTP